MRIVFMGSPSEVIPPLAALASDKSLELVCVVSQPPKPVGRSSQLQDPPVAAWAKQQCIKCLQPEKAKDPAFLEELRQLKPDIIVTAAYGQILSEDFLKIPSRATINIHPSALPKYRGATPVPEALLNGETKTSVTVLFTVKKLDAGPIILTKEFEILPQETTGILTERLFKESSILIVEAVSLLKDPLFTGEPQIESHATFCKKIEKDDGKIPWNSPAKSIYNRFRAYEPWPGSWTILGDKRIAITQMSLLNQPSKPESCGSFTWDKPSKTIQVQTFEHIIQIARLKPAGGKDMDAASFWNGLKDKSNARFDT